jgi:predicted peptidase
VKIRTWKLIRTVIATLLMVSPCSFNSILLGADQADKAKAAKTVKTAKTGETGKKTFKQPAKKELGKILDRTYHFKEAGKDMTYTLYLPSYYDAKIHWPLMVALHGLHSNPKQIMRYRGLTKLAEQYGYIIVAPMGYNTKGWYGSRGTSKRSNPPNLGQLSEKDVLNVLQRTRDSLNINSDRIYLMGHSMGGGGTWYLGIKYPHIWAGLAPIAPAIFQSPETLRKITHIPVVLVQGDADTLVPVGMARVWARKMKELKMKYLYIEVPKGDHVRIAYDYMPNIFEYLDQFKKKSIKTKSKTSPETSPKASPKTGAAQK